MCELNLGNISHSVDETSQHIKEGHGEYHFKANCGHTLDLKVPQDPC